MNNFNPNWVSKPGNTISEILSEKNLSIYEFAIKMNLTENNAKKLINSDLKITKNIAFKLSEVLGASSDFWIRREKHFRDGIKQNKTII